MSKPRGKRAVRANHPRNARQRKSLDRVLDLGDWPLLNDFSPLREQSTTHRRSP